MSLYENWLRASYDKDGRSIKSVWDEYVPKEQVIYEKILGEKLTEMTFKISELALDYGMSHEQIVGFVDGINDSLETPYKIDELEADSVVELKINFERLYKKMVEYKAEHLYTLPQWDGIFTPEKRKELFMEQKHSKTVVNTNKTGRNEPCPCGSGKKFKKCCGAN